MKIYLPDACVSMKLRVVNKFGVFCANKDKNKYTVIKEISDINDERILFAKFELMLTEIFIASNMHLFKTRSIMINMVYI